MLTQNLTVGGQDEKPDKVATRDYPERKEPQLFVIQDSCSTQNSETFFHQSF